MAKAPILYPLVQIMALAFSRDVPFLVRNFPIVSRNALHRKPSSRVIKVSTLKVMPPNPAISAQGRVKVTMILDRIKLSSFFSIPISRLNIPNNMMITKPAALTIISNTVYSSLYFLI